MSDCDGCDGCISRRGCLISENNSLSKMVPSMAAVLRAPGKLCNFSDVLFVFFVVLRVRCCLYNCLR